MPYYFNGVTTSGDYMVVADNTTLSGAFSVSFPRSIAIWWYPTGTVAGMSLFQNNVSASSSNNSISLQAAATSAYHRACLTDNSGSTFGGTGTQAFEADKWNLIVGIYPAGGSGSGYSNNYKSYLYKNSTLYGPATVSTGEDQLVGTLDGVNIGRLVGGSGRTEGYFCYAAIWDKELSEAEVIELQTKVPQNVASANCKFVWRLAEDGQLGSISGAGSDAGVSLTNNGATWYASGANNTEISENAPALPSLTAGASGVAKQASYYRMLRNA